MAKYVGMPLKEVYAFACEEYHLKRNSRLYNELPDTVDGVASVLQIDVSKNYIGSKGLRALLEVVRSCPSLHTLVLRDQQLSKEAVLMLCDSLVSHPSLRVLDLRQNPITIDGGRHVYDLVCANSRIEEVMLEGTEVKESLVQAIATKASRNRQHRARMEAIQGGGGGGPGGAGRRGSPMRSPPKIGGGGSSVATAAAGSPSSDAAGSGGVAAESSGLSGSGATAAGGATTTTAIVDPAELAHATLDASLAREIIHRCPTSVHSALLDEDIHASLTERCESTRCHFLDPDFSPTVEAISPVSSELPARVKEWRRIASFTSGNNNSAPPCIFPGLTPAVLAEMAVIKQQRMQQQQQQQQQDGDAGQQQVPEIQLPLPREPTSVAPEFSWFFTSLFAVLHGNDLGASLQALISPPVFNPAGVYCVKFFVDGKWRCVLVDDYLPVGADGKLALCGTEGTGTLSVHIEQQKSGGPGGAATSIGLLRQQQQQVPTATTGNVTAFWPALLLKAAAKLHGSYRALSAPTLGAPGRHPVFERPASSATVMADFSGGVAIVRQLNHAHFDSAAWFATMSELHAQRAWLIATSGADNEATSTGGIMPHHAYRVRQVRSVNGNRLVQLHSVHSRRVWIGEWGHSSPLWEESPDVAEALSYRPSSTRGPAAPFWMRYSAFLSCFSSVHACTPCLQSYTSMVEGAWVKSTAGGPAFEPTTWWSNPHYRLRLHQPSKVLLALSVPDRRFHASNVSTLGMHLLRGGDYPLRCDKDALFATTNYAVSDCVTYSAELPEGVLWVVPSAYDEGVFGRFFLRVVSSEMFSFAHENRDDHLKTFQIRCGLADSGEYQHGESNPQFAIQTLPAPKSRSGAEASVADLYYAAGAANNNNNNEQQQSGGMCRIAVQLHADCENVNVGLMLCRSVRNGAGEDNTPEGRLTAAGGGGISEDPETGDRNVDRLLGPIADDRVVARSKLIIGKTVHLDAHVPLTADPYLLVPCVLPHHSFNVPLSLTVWCSAPRATIRECPFWPCMELAVEWTRSGGLQDVAQNPQLELVVRRPHQRFLLHLEVFGVSDPSLILYVVKQQQGHETIALPPGHRVPDSAIVCNSQFVRHNTTTCEFEFIAPQEPGALPAHFIVLPCLQPPGTSARGTVCVSSEYDDFDVSLLPLNVSSA